MNGNQRSDDFAARRAHLQGLSDAGLHASFWRLARQLVEPLVEEARAFTSPSIERSVLLRMGFSSLEAQALVAMMLEKGCLGQGAGRLILQRAESRALSVRAAGLALLQGLYWEEGEPPAIPPSNPWRDCVGAGAFSPFPPLGGGKNRTGSAGPEVSQEVTLDPERKLDIQEVLTNLDAYTPRRRGWTWRTPLQEQHLGPFVLHDTSPSLQHSVPLPAAHHFGDIDPQGRCVITTEIASGRFEDDLRRMRMAAWHGADHIMVIRTAGQSHIDGLLEGTPEGVGGIPITRKQLRATRKALDAIEDEVGRPINLHSYVSGIAGPEIAVLFSEEGVNGAHQDPQYNVLYRNINMHRSCVDAAEAKRLMARAGMLQIDGAHNANATAKEAWKVMPELFVQHAINTAFSLAVGMPRELIALSTVPPTAPPAPKLWYDLPYAVALRELFHGCRLRAQQNTRYVEADTTEATATHVLDTLISRLTSADIQSTITPDEGRNVPWHYNTIAGVNTARQTFMGLDGLHELVTVQTTGHVPTMARELKERAVLMLEDMLAMGGYYAAVARGQFVDSGYFPERRGDGIVRDPNGGVGAHTLVPRAADYGAPVCGHFGQNRYAEQAGNACAAYGGCTLCNRAQIQYIDELDEHDNVQQRLHQPLAEQAAGLLRPEVAWAGDGIVCVTIFVPEAPRVAEAAALQMAAHMGLQQPEIISRRLMHPAEGSLFEIKGRLAYTVNLADLTLPPIPASLPDTELEAYVRPRQFQLVAATVGEDEHSVGLREILDIKHGGLEKYGFQCHYLGTSVPLTKVLDAAEETGACAVLISTIITHNDIHTLQMQRLHDLALERGLRSRLLLIAGGTQITDALARGCGLDAGYGRGTTGRQVATFLVQQLRARTASQA